MAQLPGAFNAQEHTGMGDFSAIPAGKYHAQIVSSEKKQAKKNPNNYFWQLVFQVTDGEFKGRKIFNNLNLVNENPQAVEIANNELKTICEACGKGVIEDTADLHNIPIEVTVKVTPATAQYAEGNRITYYKELAGVAKPPSGDSAEEPKTKKKAWE